MKSFKNSLRSQLFIYDVARIVYHYLRDYFDPYPYRRAYRKNKTIFIHIPKNGGTSVLSALGVKAGDHCTFNQYQQANPTRYKRYFSFAIIRDPEDRFLSAYSYLKNGGNGTSDLPVCDAYFKGTDVNSFVNEVFDSDFAYRVGVFRPQVLFVADSFNRVQVNSLVDFSRLDEGVGCISARAKIKFSKIEKLNSVRRDEAELTDEAKEKIRKVYAADFSLFNEVSKSSSGCVFFE